MTTLAKPQKIRLVSVLAELDALWTPVRCFPGDSRNTGDVVAAVYERREHLRAEGIPLVIGGDERSRQSGHRELRGLASRGLVQIVGRGKHRGVLLTPTGEQIARTLAPVLRVDEAWNWLLAVADTQSREFVLEMQVVGIEGPVTLDGSDPLSVLEDECLPLFAAGLLDAHSDGEGRLGYALTDKGRKAIAAGKPNKPRGLPQYDPDVGQAYIDAYQAALDSRERWKPTNGNCVVIPLGCGDWPEVKPQTKRSRKK